MASQDNLRNASAKEAAAKLLVLRESIIILMDDLAGCKQAHGLVNNDMLQQTTGMLLSAAYKLNNDDMQM
jgi:hypothetical protein